MDLRAWSATAVRVVVPVKAVATDSDVRNTRHYESGEISSHPFQLYFDRSDWSEVGTRLDHGPDG